MSMLALPIVHSEAGLTKYLKQISQFPMLSEQEEHGLAVKWHDNQDLKAAHVLVTSHLRLVAKIAMKFTGYGLPLIDIISEGNLGLMHAVKKFNPTLGNRFSTYAVWWVKAYIQDFVLKSWSIMKVGTSAAKKKLFYNLNKVKNKLSNLNGDNPLENNFEAIAKELNVSTDEIASMNNIMSNYGSSLNAQVYEDGQTELIELIADTSPSQETMLLEYDDLTRKKALLADALKILTIREQDIITERMLKDKPITLDVLSQKYGVSCERIRQIEAKALDKLKTAMVG